MHPLKKRTVVRSAVNNTPFTLDSYKQLNKGLKKKILSNSNVQTLGKAALMFSMPILAANVVSAQCSSLSLSNIVLPQLPIPGFAFDIDGVPGNDISFYEVAGCCQGKVKGLGGLSIVRTNGPYTTFSANRFASGQAIPGGLPAASRAFWIYNGANNGQWAGVGTTGFMGIKKGADYGFIEFTLVAYNGAEYTVSFPTGGIGGNAVIAGNCSSLPVEFMSFFLRTEGRDVTILWKTGSETNNAGFQIQRSTDGQHFTSIHWEEGAGTSLAVNEYKYTDKDLTPGMTYYYRLNQVDIDGQTKLSPVVTTKIQSENPEAGNFYPNPATDQVNIDISSPGKGVWAATIYDRKGAIIREDQFSLVKGANPVTLDVSSLASGVYFVKFENGEDRFYRKLMINRN